MNIFKHNNSKGSRNYLKNQIQIQPLLKLYTKNAKGRENMQCKTDRCRKLINKMTIHLYYKHYLLLIIWVKFFFCYDIKARCLKHTWYIIFNLKLIRYILQADRRGVDNP